MKKVTKLFALIVAILMMCLCLSGCDELDDLRKHHAKFVKADDYSAVTLNGQLYKRISGDITDLNPLYNSKNYEVISLTNPDVPVLLSDYYGDYLDISDNGIFMYGYINEDGYYYDSITGYTGKSFEVLYCREDKYEEVTQVIDDGIEYTKYGYGYWTYEEDDSDSIEMYDYAYEYEDDEFNYYLLSEEECDTINEIIKTTEPVINAETPYDEYYVVMLDNISEDGYFAKESYEIYIDASRNYSLNLYSYVTDEYKTYYVDEKYNDIMDKIVEKHSEEFIFYDEY